MYRLVRTDCRQIAVTLVRKDHPCLGKQLSLHETLDLKHVVLRPRDEYGFYIEQFLREHAKEDNIDVRVAHLLAMPMVVAESDLACTVPEHLARPMMKQFELEVLNTSIPPRSFPILMMWHRNQSYDPGHRWLRARILKHCRRVWMRAPAVRISDVARSQPVTALKNSTRG